jgi:hypothetical protein
MMPWPTSLQHYGKNDSIKVSWKLLWLTLLTTPDNMPLFLSSKITISDLLRVKSPQNKK